LFVCGPLGDEVIVARFEKGQRPWNYRERATEAILTRCVRNDKTGCLVWQGPTSNKGYGLIQFSGKLRKVHRQIFIEANGETDLHVLHTCDNRRCCELAHLYPDTNDQNILDKCLRDRSGKKLNIAKVKEIKRMLREGSTQAEIAARFGVHQCQISKIKRGITWGHVAEGQPMTSAAE
jgi:hypothetical protein